MTSGKLVKPAFAETAPKKKTEGTKLRADAVIERYHDHYERKSAEVKRKASTAKRVSQSSVESDNFSMCSDVIRHMNTQAGHYIPESEDDHYV